jgi:Leucine-rich repeat (LRR) protein
MLPELPDNLKYLDCTNNQLADLPALPRSLSELHCNDNWLTILPKLHYILELLNCSHNQLTVLPELPMMLKYLNCSHNQLTVLPMLRYGLKILDCRNNNISEIVAFPSHNKLTKMDIDINNLNLQSLEKYKIYLTQTIEHYRNIIGEKNQTLHNINERIDMINFKVVSGNNKEIKVSGTSQAIPRGNVDLIKSYITDRVGGRSRKRKRTRKMMRKRSRI